MKGSMIKDILHVMAKPLRGISIKYQSGKPP